MEENYLVKHSAQAPSQKVGVQRILGSRRVVGPAFFAATSLVAAAVCAGGLVVFVFVPRFGAGFVLGGGSLGASALATGEEMAIRTFGTAAVARHRVVLRATLSNLRRCPTRGPERGRRMGSISEGPSTTATIVDVGPRASGGARHPRPRT